jgi:hypothetical protein
MVNVKIASLLFALRPPQREAAGGHHWPEFVFSTQASKESGAYGGRRQSRWRPLRPAALLYAHQHFADEMREAEESSQCGAELRAEAR